MADTITIEAPATEFPQLRLPRRLLETLVSRAEQWGHDPALLLGNAISRYLEKYRDRDAIAGSRRNDPFVNRHTERRLSGAPRVASTNYDHLF